jgi:hypothetical protein
VLTVGQISYVDVFDEPRLQLGQSPVLGQPTEHHRSFMAHVRIPTLGWMLRGGSRGSVGFHAPVQAGEAERMARRASPAPALDGGECEMMIWAEFAARMALMHNVHLSMRDLERMHTKRQSSPYAELDEDEFAVINWIEHVVHIARLQSTHVSMRDLEAELGGAALEPPRWMWSGRCGARHGHPRAPSSRLSSGPYGRRG